MSPRSPEPPPVRPPPEASPPSQRPSNSSLSRWAPWLVVGLILTAVALTTLTPNKTKRTKVEYDRFLTYVEDDRVASVKHDQANGKILGQFRGTFTVKDNKAFEVQGPRDALPLSLIHI